MGHLSVTNCRVAVAASPKLKFPSVYECSVAALCCVGVTSALCTGALDV